MHLPAVLLSVRSNFKYKTSKSVFLLNLCTVVKQLSELYCSETVQRIKKKKKKIK